MTRRAQEGRGIPHHNGRFCPCRYDNVNCILIEGAKLHLTRLPTVPKDLTQDRYMLATFFEDAIDTVGRDAATCRMILSLTVEKLLRHRFVEAGRFQPRQKDLLAQASILDPELGGLARQFYLSRGLQRQVRIASVIADRCIGARGFFEWKSAPQTVEKAL